MQVAKIPFWTICDSGGVVNNLSFGFIFVIITGDFSEIFDFFGDGNGQMSISEPKKSKRARKPPKYRENKPKTQVNRNILADSSAWNVKDEKLPKKVIECFE